MWQQTMLPFPSQVIQFENGMIRGLFRSWRLAGSKASWRPDGSAGRRDGLWGVSGLLAASGRGLEEVLALGERAADTLGQ